jgi:hypothetical protein
MGATGAPLEPGCTVMLLRFVAASACTEASVPAREEAGGAEDIWAGPDSAIGGTVGGMFLSMHSPVALQVWLAPH